MTDPISDMLNIIKNAQAVGRQTVEVPFSNLKYEISRLLAKNGFVDKIEKKGKGVKIVIEISLKYKDKNPAISGMKRVSRPGQRIYTSANEIRKIKGGYGMAVISTPKGLMTGKDAKRQKLGGEVLCEIW